MSRAKGRFTGIHFDCRVAGTGAVVRDRCEPAVYGARRGQIGSNDRNEAAYDGAVRNGKNRLPLICPPSAESQLPNSLGQLINLMSSPPDNTMISNL